MNSQDMLINNWLKKYKPIYDIALTENIHQESVTDTVKNLALQRSGFENIPLKYINDKGWHRRYSYMLLLKGESEIDFQKLVNLDWLDDLSDWLAEQNQMKNFPNLGKNKQVTKVDCANALTYETSEDGAVSVYALQIYFEIRKEN